MQISEYLRESEARLGRRPTIGALGVGISNLALLAALSGEEYEITLRDQRKINLSALPEGLKIKRIYEGAEAFLDINEDILLLSPSLRRDAPELLKAAERGSVLTSDAELFFRDAKGVFAVSGSSGKSTTASIAASLLRKKYDTALVGNIGIPFAEAGAHERYIAELSSFQLMYLQAPTERAVITSLAHNHLDWHRDLEEYISTKLALLERAEYSTMSADDALCLAYLTGHSVSTVYSVRHSLDELRRISRAENYITLDRGHILLSGEPILVLPDNILSYNIANLMGAIGLCRGEYTAEGLSEVAAALPTLPHRAELFYSFGGIDYINSSIDTTPERTRVTLEALGRRVRLILGGKGKGLSILPILPTLEKYAKGIYLYGEAGREFYEELSPLWDITLAPCRLFSRFAEAAEAARADAYLSKGVTEAGAHLPKGATEAGAYLTKEAEDYCETVLLSPAATGYGEFRSFAERGDFFKRYILSSR